MKLLAIHDKKSPVPRRKAEALATYGIEVIDHSPTLFSAFAAMRVASLIDKENIEVIEVCSLKDAMSALSARQIARNNNVRVIMNVQPNTQPPKGVAGDIRHGVDAWIFPSERLRAAYPDDIKNATVIPATTFTHSTAIPAAANDTPVISWIGDITRPDRLRKFFEEAEDTEGEFSIRVCGTGDAAKVMPVVKYSRILTRAKDITWTGEDYDTEAEIAASDALLATDADTTDAEAAALLSGRPLLQPGELAACLAGTLAARPMPPTPDVYVARLVELLQ